MPRVSHFEITADNVERAKSFYEKVFGWKINRWDGPEDYWLISSENGNEEGINGAIMKRQDSSTSIISVVDIPNFDDFAKNITANGGKVLTEKMAVPGVGYFAYCKDTEGNTFGIMEENTSAK